MAKGNEQEESVKEPIKNVVKETVSDVIYRIAKASTKRAVKELKDRLKEKSIYKLERSLKEVTEQKLEKQLNGSIKQVAKEIVKDSAERIDFIQGIERGFEKGFAKYLSSLSKGLLPLKVIVTTCVCVSLVGGGAYVWLKLPPPVLSMPTNHTTVSNLTPELVWDESTLATSYGLQVSTDATFARPFIDQARINNPRYRITEELDWGTTYYWRANASNASGPSDWSETWTFTTPEPPPEPTPPTPWQAVTIPGADAQTIRASNIADIAVTPDGATLFAAVEVEVAAGITGVGAVGEYALLQSTDGGHNWTATGLINNRGPITGIAISPNFATDGTMYVAAGSVPLAAPAVFRSNDSGTTFTELKGVPPEIALTTGTTVINSIAMWPASPYPYVMVGTDTDVWVLQDMPFGIWMDQEVNNAGAVNMLEVAFAPDFAATNFIWAVTAAGVVTATNSPGAWGTILANTAVLVASVSADIAFPDDYDFKYSLTHLGTKDFFVKVEISPYLWVGLNDGATNGGVWRIRGLGSPGPSQDIQQLAAVDIRSIAVSGAMASATILAGQEDTAAISKSESGGLNWPETAVAKEPTGTGVTYVVMAPDFATSGLAYVGTSGDDSAFQVSRNAGLSWNQTGLIDTAIITLEDVMPSPDGSTLFLSTNDGTDASLWRSAIPPAIGTWERVGLMDTTGWIIRLSPEYSSDNTLYWCDRDDKNIQLSTDAGECFTTRKAKAPIIDVAVEDSSTLYFASGNKVYKGVNSGETCGPPVDGGWTWEPPVDAGIGTIFMLAMAPTYPEKPVAGHVLVGGVNGTASYSTDGAESFTPFPVVPVVGNIQMAGDTNYAGNNTVYAASSNGKVYRWVIDTSGAWQEINSAIVAVSGLAVHSGALYAADATPTNPTVSLGGVDRTLNPTAKIPDWERLISDLSGGVTFNRIPSALRCFDAGNDNIGLFAIDTANNVVYKYIDTEAKVSP